EGARSLGIDCRSTVTVATASYSAASSSARAPEVTSPMAAGRTNHHILRRNTPARSPRLTPASLRMSLAVIGSPSASRCARSIADAQIHRGLRAGVGWGAHHATSVPKVSADLGIRRKGAVGSALHITGTAGDRRDFSAKNAWRSLAQAALLDLLEQGL